MGTPIILKGSASQIKIVTGTGTVNFTSAWMSGHPSHSYDVVDVVAFGDNAHRNKPGLQDASLDFSFWYASGQTEAWSVFMGLFTSTTTRDVIYYPDSTSVGSPIITIPAVLTSFTPSGGPGDVLSIDVSFSLDGSATFATI